MSTSLNSDPLIGYSVPTSHYFSPKFGFEKKMKFRVRKLVGRNDGEILIFVFVKGLLRRRSIETL